MVRDWIHTAPDGTVTEFKDLAACLNKVALEGGMYAQRSRRM